MKIETLFLLVLLILVNPIARSQVLPVTSEIEVPEEKHNDTVSSASDLHITLDLNKITAKFLNQLYSLRNLNELNNFIKDENIEGKSHKIYIETTKETSFKRIKKVLKILEKNNIKRFFIVQLRGRTNATANSW
jgi:biopolymer transport protein ExbD